MTGKCGDSRQPNKTKTSSVDAECNTIIYVIFNIIQYNAVPHADGKCHTLISYVLQQT